MIKEGKFGTQEAICLIVITITAKAFFTSPSLLTRFVGTAGWYMTLISAATSAVGFTFIYLLLKRFPEKNIVEIFEISLGRFIGFIFSGTVAVFLMVLASVVVREFTEVIKVYILLTSPPSYIIGFLISVVIVFSYLGLETIARISKLFAYILLFSFIAVLILSCQNYEFHRMYPILGHGLKNTIINGIERSSAYGEIIIIAVIAGSLQGINEIKKAGYISLAVSGAIISISLLAFIWTFPYFTAEEVTAPMYQMAALINYGVFLQRLDPVFLFVWIVSTAISITTIFYSSVSVYCSMFRIQDKKPIIIPAAIIMFTASMVPKDIISVVQGGVQKTREYSWIVCYLLPLIALLAAVIGRKGAAKKNA